VGKKRERRPKFSPFVEEWRCPLKRLNNQKHNNIVIIIVFVCHPKKSLSVRLFNLFSLNSYLGTFNTE
jgi:hypothetical protein